MSQADKVIEHVNRWGHINSIEAIRLYGITRLARVVHDLKGSANALKAVKDDSLAKGFVKYVPDFHARVAVQRESLIRTLGNPELSEELKAMACMETAKMYTQIAYTR